MRKRLMALVAMLGVLSLFGIGAATAGPDRQPADRCEASGGMAEGCENHPGEHEEEPGEEDPCAALPDPNLVTLCQTVVGALAGGGEEDPPQDPPAEDPPAEESPCAQLPDPALVAGCDELTGALPL